MTGTDRPLRIAIVGAGPAGLHTAGALVASGRPVSVDLIEQLPAPYGLIRYGVAPDHPRIKGIVSALDRVLELPQVRLIGNVTYGRDLTLADLRMFYDATIFATGADADRDLDIPGVDAAGSHGAADFVAWYNGHPDAPRSWVLDTPRVAVLGVGNVALDVARVLARPAEDMASTDVPDDVLRGLRASAVQDVHVFGRRGPSQASFSPLELRELAHIAGIRVAVDPEDLVFDAASRRDRSASRQIDAVCSTLERWSEPSMRDHRRTIHLHFLEAPTEICVDRGHVVGLRTERMELDGTGTAVGTGQINTWPVTAVYRAIGYRSRPLPDLPFDARTHTVPHVAGRVVDSDGVALTGIYVTGWIKRGPVGLVGHTKNDANETVATLLQDFSSGGHAQDREARSITDHLERRRIRYTTFGAWRRLDERERSLGQGSGRERVKLVDRSAMLAAAGA